MNNLLKDHKNKEKVVLAMLPYWTPLVPPQGIGMLKTYLTRNGYNVKNVDLNVEDNFKKVYTDYFEKIKAYVPTHKRGNLYNIGHDVLHNHMMAAFKYTDEEKYTELVKLLVYHTFYTNISTEQAKKLSEVISTFYSELELYVINLIKNERPNVIGLSVFKGNIPASIFVAKKVKKIDSNIKVVIGGGTFADSHAVGTPNYYDLLKETEDCVDQIMVGGQGELLFLKFLQGETVGKKVVTLKDLGLDAIPFEELGIADLDDFNIDAYPYIIATGSNSCPHKCSFCCTPKYSGKYKKKDTKLVVDEMIHSYNKYGNQLFFMSDCLLNPIIDDLANQFIQADKTLYYDCYFRVSKEACKIENTYLWRRGGLYRTRMGIESGSQKVLDLMHKGITVEQSKATLYALASAGIKTTAYIVIGHPGETEEDFQQTLDLITEMKDYIWQAEPNAFYYHYAGQSDSDSWADKRKLLYPESMRDMLVFDTWTLKCDPLREETYKRLNRFMDHCNKLGIPNPYNATELYEADVRWKKLHKNAVPSIWEFEKWGKEVNEAKRIVMPQQAKNILDKGDFEF